MDETKLRSVSKTIVWRVLATLITLVVAYWFTGSFGEATEISLVAALLSTAAYYLHERVWNKIRWGRTNV